MTDESRKAFRDGVILGAGAMTLISALNIVMVIPRIDNYIEGRVNSEIRLVNSTYDSRRDSLDGAYHLQLDSLRKFYENNLENKIGGK